MKRRFLGITVVAVGLSFAPRPLLAAEASPIDRAYELYTIAANARSAEICATTVTATEMADRWRNASKRLLQLGLKTARSLDAAYGDDDRWFFTTYSLLYLTLRSGQGELATEFREGVLRVGCKPEHAAEFETFLSYAEARPPITK